MSDIPIANPEIGQAERANVLEVLESGQLAEGDVVHAFESEFADYCGASEAVATANGTTALHAALEAVGVEPGSNVVTTPFSFVASANAIRLAGGVPVFADIDPETYTLDPNAVEECLRDRDNVDAILVVHLYGLPADMAPLRDLAEEYDVPLVEDAAQAHGATYRGEPVGALGDVACFSFYPTKNMTTGEGGMVTTDREDVAERVARFVNHGRGEGRYEHVELGHNYRMTNLAAAIGRAQLERLPAFVRARRVNARRLTERLADAAVTTPSEPDDRRHSYHQYTIRAADRDRLAAHLEDRGIGTGIYYPTPIHELEAYEQFSTSAPIAERAAAEVLSLPVHPGVEEDDVDQIATAVREVEARV